MYFMICIFAAIGLTTVKSPLVFAAENTVFYDEEAADSSSEETESASEENGNTTADGKVRKIDPSGNGDGYATVLYNNSNGLPTSEANAIAQTPDGFIWIGGYSGLTRYDGNTFKRYDSTTGIDSVVSLFVDSKDRLWIGTNETGVAVLEKGELTFFDQVEGLKSSSIRAITEDDAGNIYIATTHGMAMVDTDMVLSALNFSQLDDEYIVEIRKGPDDTIYGVTIDGDVFGIKDKKIVYYFNSEDIGIEDVNCVFPDQKNPGHLYIGTESSIVAYVDISNQMDILTTYDVSPHVKINRIDVFEDYIWICADNGIGYIRSNGKYITLKNLSMTSSVDDMLADYEGNLWFVSSRQGVMKIVPNIFRDISARAGLPDTVVNTTCARDGLIYIGTDKGLIILNSLCASMKTALTDMLDGVRIRSIMLDSQENLWIATYSDYGLVKVDKSNNIRTFTMDDGLLAKKVRTTVEASDGSIFVATPGGMNIIKDEQVVASYGADNGISNTEILTICEGDNGKIYLGSDGDGIYVIDGKNITRISKSDGLKSEVILRIVKDPSRDMFWVITSNSLAYMQNDKVTTIDRFPYSNNFDIKFDESGNLWILSSNGIYIANPENLIKNENIDYMFYDSKCGLPCVATANSFSFLDDKGILYIAGTTGVSSVNIREAKEETHDIKLIVPFVEADDKFIYPDEDGKIRIPSSTTRLTVYPYAFTYSLRNPKISYELIGVDKEGGTTVTKQELSSVSYTNLKGGEYTFKLTIHNTVDGGERSITVVIDKEKAIYEKLWCKIVASALVILFIGLMASAYTAKRTEALLKKQEENRKFIDEMVEAFAMCVDVKDKYTNGHSFRVAEYTKMFAAKMGYSGDELEDIHRIALLHDIGKISTPIDILNKPGKLTDEEFAIMKQHAANGYEILKGITVMPNLALGAGYHHERIDGKGYPRGLKGDEIPEIAQVIAVADCLDAMTSTRPYRKAMTLSKAISIIKDISGTQLSSKVVDIFLQLVDEGAFDELRAETEGQQEEKKEEKPEGQQEEKKEEKPERKTEEKKEERPEGKTEEKKEDKAEEKTEDKKA